MLPQSIYSWINNKYPLKFGPLDTAISDDSKWKSDYGATNGVNFNLVINSNQNSVFFSHQNCFFTIWWFVFNFRPKMSAEATNNLLIRKPWFLSCCLNFLKHSPRMEFEVCTQSNFNFKCLKQIDSIIDQLKTNSIYFQLC